MKAIIDFFRRLFGSREMFYTRKEYDQLKIKLDNNQHDLESQTLKRRASNMNIRNIFRNLKNKFFGGSKKTEPEISRIGYSAVQGDCTGTAVPQALSSSIYKRTKRKMFNVAHNSIENLEQYKKGLVKVVERKKKGVLVWRRFYMYGRRIDTVPSFGNFRPIKPITRPRKK